MPLAAPPLFGDQAKAPPSFGVQPPPLLILQLIVPPPSPPTVALTLVSELNGADDDVE